MGWVLMGFAAICGFIIIRIQDDENESLRRRVKELEGNRDGQGSP